MKTYKAYNIQWDTDEEKIELPSEVIFNMEDDDDPSIDGANVISDMVGWCINSFFYEEIA